MNSGFPSDWHCECRITVDYTSPSSLFNLNSPHTCLPLFYRCFYAQQYHRIKWFHKIFNAFPERCQQKRGAEIAIGKFIYFHRINDANCESQRFYEVEKLSCFMNTRKIMPGQGLMQRLVR